jgi:hypothetical protein
MASSVAEKNEKLKIRAEAEKMVNEQIERNMRVSFGEDDDGNCGPCRSIFGRRRRLPVPTGEAAPAKRSGVMFGVGKRIDPHAKLAEAASALEERIGQLELRVSEGRMDAATAMRAGKKQLAMRLLKKTKLVEQKLAANQKSLDAIEAQLLLMSEAAMQKTLASALASSSKGLKNQSKLIAKAESAVDTAADARDMATELNDVFAEFTAGNGTGDDDDLLAELNAMVGDDPSPVTGETAGQAIERLEAKHEQWDEIELARQKPVADTRSVFRRRRSDDRAQLLELGASV